MTAWHLCLRLGGFQNPGVCLQAFPSFLPSPFPSPSFTHSIHRPVILCSRTAQKRLLRRLRCGSRCLFNLFFHIYSGLIGHRSRKQQNVRIPKSLRKSQRSLVNGRMQCCLLTNKQHDHNLRMRSHDPVCGINGGQQWHGKQTCDSRTMLPSFPIFSNQSYQNWPIATKTQTTSVKRRGTYECQARESTKRMPGAGNHSTGA